MRPLQRRALALCIFALAFVLFYEARGRRLVNLWGESTGAPALEVFQQNAVLGTVVLLLGGTLLLYLRRAGEVFQYSLGELVCMALGLGLLLGTLAVSWMHVSA